MRAIHFAPRAPLSLLARRPNASMAEALAVAPQRFHFSRDALHAWFSSQDKGYVWMPSFHCGMEVRSAADAGFTPRFYRVREDMTVDEEDLARRLHLLPGPVLVIHYLGIPQPGIARIAALCRERGVPLLEDCSHAFLSSHEGQPLGTFGDAATFSLYKSLGTVDGGALRTSVILSRFAQDDTPDDTPFIAWDAHLGSWRRRWRDRSTTNLETLRRRFAHRVVTAQKRIFDGPWLYGRGISRLSLALIVRMDAERIRGKRREHWERLGGAPLAEGVVPLFFPIFVRDRAEVLVQLQAQRIEPFIFGMFHHPSMRASEFPETKRLREELLCLPVHQDLADADLARLKKVVP